MEESKGVKVVGIDVGINLGYAEFNSVTKKVENVCTTDIGQALKKIFALRDEGWRVYVRVEDARQFFAGNSGNSEEFFNKGKLQGAGHIKGQCYCWDNILTAFGIEHEMARLGAVMKGKKMDDATFKAITKYTGRTSKHSRDAVLLCVNYVPRFNSKIKDIYK